MPSRKVRSDGERSREMILNAAAELATVDGLDGLSIGRLADVTGMSKSGVYGLFGSKEGLQLATVAKARRVFIKEVIAPALDIAPGKAQLLALCEGYLAHVERRVFPGGCFFASVASEVSSHPGPVRDRVAEDHTEWIGLLAANATQAVHNGDLPASTDPEALTMELGTMLTGADIAYLLHEDQSILDGIRAAIQSRLA